jgi:hypothetical protein
MTLRTQVWLLRTLTTISCTMLVLSGLAWWFAGTRSHFCTLDARILLDRGAIQRDAYAAHLAAINGPPLSTVHVASPATWQDGIAVAHPFVVRHQSFATFFGVLAVGQALLTCGLVKTLAMCYRATDSRL